MAGAAVQEVPLDWVETPVLKELYAAMRSRPGDVGSPGFLDALPEGRAGMDQARVFRSEIRHY
jgi:hypothetical protein